MTDVVQQQTEQLLKELDRLLGWLTMIHYDLLAIVLLVFVFGMITSFRKR